jgi:hypothetical protein
MGTNPGRRGGKAVTNRLSYGTAYPDLNPTEPIWGLVKKHVARKNANSRLDDVMKMAEEKFSTIMKEELSSTRNIVCHKDLTLQVGEVSNLRQ